MPTCAGKPWRLVIAVTAACQRPPSCVDLAPELAPVRTAHGLPALAMAVWRHGQLIARGVTGLRKADDPAHPATFDDRWHLGSDTKAMTATLIGVFVDRGVVHWDDTLDRLFPGETISPGYRAVTLDQLLRHRGGAPGAPRLAMLQLRLDGTTPGARLAFARTILADPPAQPPGTFAYANAGYIIAAAALERATGMRWERLMQDELFGPLGMTSCGFGAPGDATRIDQPWGHTTHPAAAADDPWRSGGTTRVVPVSPASDEADNPPGLGPAGTVHCALADWGKFLDVHATGAPAIVTASTLAHLHEAPTIDDERYASGWAVSEPRPGELRLGHEGSNTLWHAIAIVVPGTATAIAIVANSDDDALLDALEPVVDRYL
jgi:CubicO group peptidase (beta-lactamase class C family)